MTNLIQEAWQSCLEKWTPLGRVEDFPRSERRPKYAPSTATIAGREFARKFKDEYPFLIDRLAKGDDLERLCAFECLEYVCWEYYIGNVPQPLLSIEAPIPPVIVSELSRDPDTKGFSGATVGDLFTHMFGDAKDA